MRGSPVKGRDVWDVKKLLEVTSVVGYTGVATGGTVAPHLHVSD